MTKLQLFSPLRLGPYQLKHRVILAPLTRMRAAQPGNVPNELNTEYYAQRASNGGLLVNRSERKSLLAARAIPPRPVSTLPNKSPAGSASPKPHTTKAAKFFFSSGTSAASLILRINRMAACPLHPLLSVQRATPSRLPGSSLLFETPRELALSEIPSIVDEYRVGARNALAAGFDASNCTPRTDIS